MSFTTKHRIEVIPMVPTQARDILDRIAAEGWGLSQMLQIQVMETASLLVGADQPRVAALYCVFTRKERIETPEELAEIEPLPVPVSRPAQSPFVVGNSSGPLAG